MPSGKTRHRAAKKSGRKFEELIAWIQRSVHQRANIGLNERIKDIDTGKPRQVDITIRLSDGPTEFLGIVEVRDRSRPIGIRYVEEISGKRRSVRADAAFLVSRSDFTKTAITKARQLGIRTLTYEEAQSGDWSSWLQCRTFSVIYRKYDKPVVFLFEYGTDKAINPSSEGVATLKTDPAAKIILDEHGTPILSLPDLVNKIVNVFGEKPYRHIPLDGIRVKRRLFFQGMFKPTLWIRAEGDIRRQIGKVGIETELYWESKEYPLKLMRYRELDSTASIAELAAGDVEISGKKYRFEILAPGAGEYIPAGTVVSFRSVQLEDGSDQ